MAPVEVFDTEKYWMSAAVHQHTEQARVTALGSSISLPQSCGVNNPLKPFLLQEGKKIEYPSAKCVLSTHPQNPVEIFLVDS